MLNMAYGSPGTILLPLGGVQRQPVMVASRSFR